jgi:DNA-binding winged helix-turn-helix (wHTH) protein/tetratricopeptide (TPR) repeat protein
MTEEDKELYEFGNFRLDVAEHALTRLDGSKNGQLTEKSFQTLCVLVQKSGRLLSKKELIDQIWPDTFVEENNLDKCIHAIRHVLGEKPNEQRYIQTVRKHGYRFVAEVRKVVADSPADNASANSARLRTSQPVAIAGANEVQNPSVLAPGTHSEDISVDQTQPIYRAHKKRIAAVLVSSVLLIAAGATYYYFSSKSPSGGKKSIAVLPLKPVNAEARDDLYDIGIADSVIHRLGTMKGLTVRPLSAIRKYTDVQQDAVAAGKEQKVDYVLASNYQIAAGNIRISSQLFNVSTGQIEEIYKSEEKTLGNVFGLQDEVADEIGNVISARFLTGISKPLTSRGTDNEEAYRLYLQGMFLYGKRTSADAAKAAGFLEQAVVLDRDYARAWAGLAHVHRSIGNFGGSDVHEEYRKSMEAVGKALALDKNLADAHSALCENKMAYEWDFVGADGECRRAIELDPNSSLAHLIYSRLLNGQGRFDEAIREVTLAVDLDPSSLFAQRNYGVSLYYARRYPEAVTQFKRVLEMEKGFGTTYNWIVVALEMQGNYQEAFEWFEKARSVNFPGPENAEVTQAYRTAYETAGWPGMILEQIKRFEDSKTDKKKTQPPVYFQGAVLYAKAGNREKAFEHLEESYRRRELWMGLLKVEPGLDSLHDDPRFNELAERVGLS